MAKYCNLTSISSFSAGSGFVCLFLLVFLFIYLFVLKNKFPDKLYSLYIARAALNVNRGRGESGHILFNHLYSLS